MGDADIYYQAKIFSVANMLSVKVAISMLFSSVSQTL